MEKLTVGIWGDEEGNYSIDLPRGESDLTIYVERAGYAKGEAQAVDTSGATASMDLVSGAAKVKVNFNLKDQDGNPVYGKLELFDAEGNSAYPQFVSVEILSTRPKKKD